MPIVNAHRPPAEQVALDREKAAHPYLIADESLSSHARAGKNARILLKREFPGTRFRVWTAAFAGGTSMTVSWPGVREAPEGREVHCILAQFEQGEFNGMDDSYSYATEGRHFREAFGGVRFLRVERTRVTPAEVAAIDAESLNTELPAVSKRGQRRARF